MRHTATSYSPQHPINLNVRELTKLLIYRRQRAHTLALRCTLATPFVVRNPPI